MRKEIGKWFMDIAKYILTAVIVGNLMIDIQNVKWQVYAGGIIVTAICFSVGLIFLHDSTKAERS